MPTPLSVPERRAPGPPVVDLGCGAGSIGARLLRRRPAATVVSVDADPVLIALAAARKARCAACGSSSARSTSPTRSIRPPSPRYCVPTASSAPEPYRNQLRAAMFTAVDPADVEALTRSVDQVIANL